MTDLATPNTPPLAAPGIDADRAQARRDRLDELQRRRATQPMPIVEEPTLRMPQVMPAQSRSARQPRSTRSARAGAAQGSKIAAAGFGLAGMLGLVAVMGFDSASSASIPPPDPAQIVPPAQVIVVLHPAATAPTGGDTVPESPTSAAPTSPAPTAPAVVPGVVPAAAVSGGPIVLTAQPVVRQAPAAQAAPAAQVPAAQTNGSR